MSAYYRGKFVVNALTCRRLSALSVKTPFQNDPFGPKARKTIDCNAINEQLATIRTAYTGEQQKKIMDVINNGNLETFLTYDVGKKLAATIAKKKSSWHVGGCFQDFEYLIRWLWSVDFDHLHVFFDSIVYGLSNEGKSLQKTRWRVCYPEVSNDVLQELDSLIMLQLHSDGASWLHLTRDRKILDWRYLPLANLDRVRENRESLQLARSVVEKLAVADAYLMDDRKLDSTSLILTPLLLHAVRIECMIAAMLGGRHWSMTDGINRHKPPQRGHCLRYDGNPRVFFVRNEVVGNYFSLRVGNEQVSGQNLIDDLLASRSTNDALRHRNLEKAFADDETTRSAYLKQPPVIREHLANALLKAVAFYQLEVAKMPLHAIGTERNHLHGDVT